MPENLPWWLTFQVIHHGDPGPEVFNILADLPVEQRGPIVAAISAARGELDTVRAKGYAQIGAAVAAAVQGKAD